MVTARPFSYSTRNRPAWQEAAAVAAILFGLTLVFFWPQVGQGRALYWGDIGLYFTPMAEFLRDSLRRGVLPLWDPLILCGTPYVGDPQTWPLYPVSALLPLLPAPYFLSLTVALHVWLAGLGTFVFARRSLDLGRRAALLGAVTFMFGGWLVSKEQFPNMVQAASYLPWVLWSEDRVILAGRRRDALTLGLILGLQLLAAHAQMTLWTLYLAAAWGLFRLPQCGRLILLPARLAPAGAVAFGLSAGQVLPTLQLFHDGWRQDLPFRVVNRFYLPLNQTANWVLPTLHGQPLHGNFTARGNFWETCCYVGLLPFLLAVFGAAGGLRRGGGARVRFWAVTFIVGVLMALGGGADSRPGPYWLAYHTLPGFHSFHDPARCLIWSSFALAVLAAAGLERIRHRVRRPRVLAAIVVLLAFADLAHFGRTIYPLADPGTLFPVTRTVAALQNDPQILAHQARFMAPDSARVWQRFTGHKDYRQDAPGYQALWADTLTPNLPMAYGLPDAYGYEPVTRRDAQQALGALQSLFRPNAPYAERDRAAADAGFYGVRFVATDRVLPPEPSLPGLTPLFADPSLPPLTTKRGAQVSRVFLSLNSRWQPRARLVMSLGGASPAPARITEDTPDRVTVTADDTGQPYLLLADTLHPGWSATVDSRPVTISRAAGFLRAVPLPGPGPHTVVFAYRPVTFLLGLYLTLLTAGGLLGAAVFGLAANRRRILTSGR